MLTRFNRNTEEQCLEIGKQYYNNFKNYGATSWYHWCIDNWGTKWNACDIYMASEDIIVFYTAWNHPEPVIQKISELFDVNVKLAYADENFNGCNCGFMEYDQGQLQYEWYPDYVDQLAEFSNHVPPSPSTAWLWASRTSTALLAATSPAPPTWLLWTSRLT